MVSALRCHIRLAEPLALVRWFVGLGIDDVVWDATTFEVDPIGGTTRTGFLVGSSAVLLS